MQLNAWQLTIEYTITRGRSSSENKY